MHQDFAQRRRVAVALAITVILVPAALLLNRGGDEADPPTTVVGDVLLPGATSAPSSPDAPTATDVMGSTPTGFLDGTVPSNTDDLPTIAIPRPTESIKGSASFSRSITDATRCVVRDLAAIPLDASVTITNLDNSRSVRCIASAAGSPPDADVVLHPDAFLRIGDLTDAPLSVEILW